MAYVSFSRAVQDFTCPGVSFREQNATGTVGCVAASSAVGIPSLDSVSCSRAAPTALSLASTRRT